MAIYLIKMAPTCLLCFCCFFVCFQLVKTSKIWSFLSNLLLQFKLQTRFLERKLQFWVVITSWKRRFGSENEVSFLNWYNWYNLEMKLLFQNISFDSPTEASILETKHLLKQTSAYFIVIYLLNWCLKMNFLIMENICSDRRWLQ